MSPPRKRRKVAATPSNSDDESMRGLEYNPVVTTPRKIFIRRRSPPNPGAREVIEISSSDEDSHGPLTPSATTQRALENQREIIEISSDEDDDPQQPTTVSRLAPKLPSLQRDIIEISSDEELASPRRRLYRKWSSTHDDSKVEGNPLSSDNGSEPDARNSDDESEKSDGALSVASPRWRIYRKRSSSNHDDPKIQEDSPSGLDGGSDPDSRNSGEESEKSDGALSAAGPQRRIYRKRSLSNQVSSRLGSDDDDDRVEPDTRDSDTDAAEAKAAIEIWRYKNRTPRQHFDVFLDCVVQLVLDRKFLSKLYEDDEYYSTAIIALRRDNDIHASQIAKATWKPPFVAALDLRHLLRGNQQDSDSDSDSDFDLDFDLDFEEDDSDSSGDEQGDEGREQDDQTEDSDSSRDDRDPKADYYRSACHACWTRGRYYCSYDGFLQLWTKRGMYNPDTFQKRREKNIKYSKKTVYKNNAEAPKVPYPPEFRLQVGQSCYELAFAYSEARHYLFKVAASVQKAMKELEQKKPNLPHTPTATRDALKMKGTFTNLWERYDSDKKRWSALALRNAAYMKSNR